MAIYHCSIKNIGRSQGKSAVACASYRSGSKLYDEERFKFFDYTSKDNVAYAKIHLCDNAPEEYKDRATLWNAVQKVESADNARLAREFEVAIPNELSYENAVKVVEDYAHILISQGMCADVCIHWKNGNHHAHIMCTTRPIKENGEWGNKERKQIKIITNKKGEEVRVPVVDPAKLEAWEKENGRRFDVSEASAEDIKAVQKVRVRKGKGEERLWERELVESTGWNKKETLEQWREQWSDSCNKYLEEENQIDHRSHENRGIEDIPTIHEGYAAREIEKRGGVSELCEYNRTVKEINNNRNLLTMLRNQFEIGKGLWDKFEGQIREWIENHRKTKEAPTNVAEAPVNAIEAPVATKEEVKVDIRKLTAEKALEAYKDTSKPLLTAEECKLLENYEYKADEYKLNEANLLKLKEELAPIKEKLDNTYSIMSCKSNANSYNSELNQLRNELAEEQSKNIFRRSKNKIESLQSKIKVRENCQRQYFDEANEYAKKPHFEFKELSSAKNFKWQCEEKIKELEKAQSTILSERMHIKDCVTNSKWYKHDRSIMLENSRDRS